MTDWMINADEAAEMLGVAKRRIYKYREQGMPMVGRGKYHVPTIVQWVIREKSGNSVQAAKDINEQRQMLYKAQTEKTELENAQIRGDLLKSDVVQTTYLQLGTLVRTQIEAIEPRLARQFTPEQTAIIRQELKLALESIARDVETFADSRNHGADHPTTA